MLICKTNKIRFEQTGQFLLFELKNYKFVKELNKMFFKLLYYKCNSINSLLTVLYVLLLIFLVIWKVVQINIIFLIFFIVRRGSINEIYQCNIIKFRIVDLLGIFYSHNETIHKFNSSNKIFLGMFLKYFLSEIRNIGKLQFKKLF